MWLWFCGLESDWLAAGGYETLARSCGGLSRQVLKKELFGSFLHSSTSRNASQDEALSVKSLYFSSNVNPSSKKMMTTAAIPRRPLGDVSNKENLAPMKSKNKAPSLPIDTENGFQQVSYAPFCVNLKR